MAIARVARLGLVFAMLASLLTAVAAHAAGPTSWQPSKVRFGVGVQKGMSVTLDDGVVIKFDRYFPTDLHSGKPARGSFPIIFQMTQYSRGAASGDPYFVGRGYQWVIADARGTGDSGGYWENFQPSDGHDGAQIVRWLASNLPNSNHKVGMFGESYLGLTQFEVAAAIGPHSPLRAIFPIVPNHDAYRDGGYPGGLQNAAAAGIYYGLVAGLNAGGPLLEPDVRQPGYTSSTFAQHVGSTAAYIAKDAAGEDNYDGPYWWSRSPGRLQKQIVANGIPAFMVAGWYDIFLSRAHLLNYTGFQNAWNSRPVDAPMLPGEPVTGRYQLVMGPNGHTAAQEGIDTNRLALEWFDTFLKGQQTGIDHVSRPLHVIQLGSSRYVDVKNYPFTGVSYNKLYLSAGASGSGAASINDGTLTATRPAAGSAADPIAFTPTAFPCNGGTDQATLSLTHVQQCYDEAGAEVGLGALTYTSAPMSHPTVLAGPIEATLFATSTRPDTEFVVRVDMVAPDGTRQALTRGQLLGSFRAVDERAVATWRTPDGSLLVPYHPFTQASQRAVPTGKVVRYDVEVNPTLAVLPAGYRIRVTINTSDAPYAAPTADRWAELAGGIYSVQRNLKAASYVLVPLAPKLGDSRSCSVCQP